MMPRVLAAGFGILLLVSACATTRLPPPSRDVIVLLPDPEGKTGAILVSGAGDERLLSKPRQAVEVSAGAAPGKPYVMPEDEVRDLFGPALDALPKPPVQFILYFKHDSDELTKDSIAKLPEVMRVIRERAPVDVSVVGHTDTVGDKLYNYKLSLKRARALASLLVSKGVDRSILEITSHGKDNPLVPTGDQVSEPRNRRVEVTVR